MIKQLLLFFCLTISVYGQTGPAGVGSSNNNVLWLKADAGTSSTTNNAPISFWNDQSGNAINVTQTVATQQPSFATNLMNGMPAIRFDNTATTNDKLVGPDSPSLDNTSGYTFFTVVRMQNIDNEARSIISKRVNVGVDQSFMLFLFSNKRLYLDLQTNNNRFNTTTQYTTNTNYIFNAYYNGTLALNQRARLYTGETLEITSAETNTLIPDNNSPLIIGSTHLTDGRPFGGYMAEIITYTTSLNDAQRIIVNNYLSSKYDISLSINDKYLGDEVSNGNYDYEVAGVGMESTGSNPSFSASICGGLGISTTGIGLDNTDYVLAGHASFTNTQIFTDVGGMTGPNNSRWSRIWYIDVTNTSSNINTNIEFDMSDGGIGNVLAAPAANYVLLYRSGQSGNWTELATASAISGDKVLFNGIDLVNDGYYTIGSKNHLASPLPIELVGFNAIRNTDKVNIFWRTASEKMNDYFTVEKSKDAVAFETLSIVKGSSNSNVTLEYSETDFSPFDGISYYRLKQTDINGKFTYSKIVAVNYHFDEQGVNVYPNPNNGNFSISLKGFENKEVLVLLRDVSGKECYSKVMLSQNNEEIVAIDLENKLPTGTYLVVASSLNKLYSKKIIVK